tara:strand:+ start:17552 stop:17791 length:240 start_codon:yes stop_codon:yes gene_type:complete
MQQHLLQLCELLEIDFAQVMSVLRDDVRPATSSCAAVVELKTALSNSDTPQFSRDRTEKKTGRKCPVKKARRKFRQGTN